MHWADRIERMCPWVWWSMGSKTQEGWVSYRGRTRHSFSVEAHGRHRLTALKHHMIQKQVSNESWGLSSTVYGRGIPIRDSRGALPRRDSRTERFRAWRESRDAEPRAHGLTDDAIATPLALRKFSACAKTLAFAAMVMCSGIRRKNRLPCV